ncbi:MAG TPA: hypothetical protein PKM15_04645 [bacterium]|nr:hypothetical protein [bacterium]
MAEGTKEKPIVFTSAKEDGERARGDWGGLLVNGWAPVNCAGKTSPCQRQAETGVEWYGGDKADDNSGTLKYVRIEFTGFKINSEKEFNGLTLQGVGNKTTIEYIHTHMGNDDAIEFFGGTVNAKYILCTGAGDDNLDWTFGFSGKIQHVMIEQYEDEADKGIEADTNDKQLDDTPVSMPTVSNVTIIGTANSSTGMIFRAGTGGKLHNVLVTGNPKCLDIDEEQTFKYAEEGKLGFKNTILSCTKNFDMEDEKDEEENPIADAWPTSGNTLELWFEGQTGNSVVADPKLDGWLPKSDSPALGNGVKPDDSFFDAVDYIGAFKDVDWTEGWTEFPKN